MKSWEEMMDLAPVRGISVGASSDFRGDRSNVIRGRSAASAAHRHAEISHEVVVMLGKFVGVSLYTACPFSIIGSPAFGSTEMGRVEFWPRKRT